MSHEVESIGTDVGEDLVGELCVSDVYDEFSDEVVGGEAGGGSGRCGLLVPEGSGVSDERDGVSDDGRDKERARDVTFLDMVRELL